MNHWRYKNKTITSLEQLGNPLLLFGFVYRVTGPTGKWYLGKKNFNTKRKKKLTKKELSTDKRLKTYKHVVKESTWTSYWGSNKALLEDIARLGHKHFTREIIALAYSAKELTYLEMEYQIRYDVLRFANCYNENICGKFFPRDLKQIK